MTYKEFMLSYPDHKEALEERAAIVEFLAGCTQEEAEALAVKILSEKVLEDAKS